MLDKLEQHQGHGKGPTETVLIRWKAIGETEEKNKLSMKCWKNYR